jgi:hypothetical protein
MTTVIHDERRAPPGFGDGKPWRIRVVEWERFDDDEKSGTMFIPRGMSVNPAMHEHYFGVEAHVRRVLEAHAAAGVAKPNVLVLLGPSRTVVGSSPLLDDDGPAEIAFLSCAFVELLGVNCALPIDDAVVSWDPADSIGKVNADMSVS